MRVSPPFLDYYKEEKKLTNAFRYNRIGITGKEASYEITYIHHSSFLVELESVYLLFDYTEGVIPGLKGKSRFWYWQATGTGTTIHR